MSKTRAIASPRRLEPVMKQKLPQCDMFSLVLQYMLHCFHEFSLSIKHLRRETCFISDENLVVFYLVGIKLHPPDPNGRHLLAFYSTNN